MASLFLEKYPRICKSHLTNSVIISDTSCLIALDRIGQLEILHKLFSTITTTFDVQKEFEKPLPNWISIKQVENKERIRELEQTLDTGEASAISLALETAHSILIIDEKRGRSVARRFQSGNHWHIKNHFASKATRSHSFCKESHYDVGRLKLQIFRFHAGCDT